MYLVVVRQLFGFSITTFRDTFIGLLSPSEMVIEIEAVSSQKTFIYQNLFCYQEVYKIADFVKLNYAVIYALFSWQEHAEAYP